MWLLEAHRDGYKFEIQFFGSKYQKIPTMYAEYSPRTQNSSNLNLKNKYRSVCVRDAEFPRATQKL